MRRMIRGGVYGVFVVLMACGGVTREDSGTPSDQLHSSGGSKCKSACATVVACGPAKSSCDCGCSCAAGASNCDCGPCDCPGTTKTPQ